MSEKRSDSDCNLEESPCKKANLTKPIKSEYNRQFPQKWLDDPKFSCFVRSSNNKTYCKICNRDLSGSITVLEKHIQCEKHLKNQNELEEEPHSPKIILGIEHPTLGESPKQMVSKVMQAADGTSIVIQSRDDLFKCDNRNTGEINSITELVTSVFQKDLARLLRKDATLRKLALSRSYYEGKEGRAKLTKTLVGHLSLHYLTEFNDTKEPEVNIVSHLHDIKQQIQKSVEEMKSMTAQMVHKESVQQHTHSEETSMIMIQDS